MSNVRGTVDCPLCGHPIHVTITLSTIPVEVGGARSFTTIAAPQFSHTCAPPAGADDVTTN